MGIITPATPPTPPQQLCDHPEEITKPGPVLGSQWVPPVDGTIVLGP